MKIINEIQAIINKKVVNLVFCASCMDILGTTTDETHDFDNILCKNCSENE